MPNPNLLESLSHFFQTQDDITLAWVFGSFANGTQKPESDIDIAVAGRVALSADRRVELASDLEKRFKRPIDLVDLHLERGIIASQVLTRGKILLNRDPIYLAYLVKRMWYDRADHWPHRATAFANRRKQAFNS